MPGSTLIALGHKDLFTLGDRSFRWEYPDDSPYVASTSPKKGFKVLTPKAKAPTPKTPKSAKKEKKKSPGGKWLSIPFEIKPEL